ncbi:MAG: hypothetical protein Ct9H90mP23_3570 [Methanobacteriota archaeon]|nr:MAG: hypothetical protein Ct9H90mP23_3570 [Euryarchaeota archaeon]
MESANQDVSTQKICDYPWRKSWQVILDVFAISDDGNLFDAFGLAAIAALRSARFQQRDLRLEKICRSMSQRLR